eukprot:364988-Chlamydomonas_euryale.AAC.23
MQPALRGPSSACICVVMHERMHVARTLISTGLAPEPQQFDQIAERLERREARGDLLTRRRGGITSPFFDSARCAVSPLRF